MVDELKQKTAGLRATQEELGRELRVFWLNLLEIDDGILPSSYDWETKVLDIVEDAQVPAATFTMSFTRLRNRSIQRTLQLRVHAFTLAREKDQSPFGRPDGVIRTIVNWLRTDEDDASIDYELVGRKTVMTSEF
jgi:hypothetical protein